MPRPPARATPVPRSAPTRPPRVALMIDTIGDYGREAVAGVARYVRGHQRWDFYCDPQRTSLVLDDLLTWNPDGLITSRLDPDQTTRLREQCTPNVVVLSADTRFDGFPVIRSDDAKIGELVAEYFLERGYSRFAYCGFRETLFSAARGEAFRQVVEAAGYDVHEYESAVRFDAVDAWDRSKQRLVAWLKSLPLPIAVFACNDVRGRHVSLACDEAGLAIPTDVALIGCDNDQLECDFSKPPLSSVDPGAADIGYAAAELLDRMLQGEAPRPGVFNLPPQGVVMRASSDIVAFEDPDLEAAVRFIKSNFHRPIQVGDVVDATNLSRRSLERRIQGALKGSVHRQILVTRLRHAQSMLKATTLSVAQIAEKCGFRYAHRFSGQFKREFGVSPSAYRDQHATS